MTRRPVTVRLTEEEVAMFKKRGRGSVSKGVRDAINEPPPVPTIGEVIAAGGRVEFEDRSGRFTVGEAPRVESTYPPIRTEAGRLLSFTLTPNGGSTHG